jgi:hypothetical protein
MLDYLLKINHENSYFSKENKDIFFGDIGNKKVLMDRLIDLQCQYELKYSY